eukprot:2372205-Karenia_brevis.AAC.1
MSWEVPESHLVGEPGPLGKPFVEQGFISDKSTWADATEEEQSKMEENLWLPDQMPTPRPDKMPALSAARKSSVSAKGMATAL